MLACPHPCVQSGRTVHRPTTTPPSPPAHPHPLQGPHAAHAPPSPVLSGTSSPGAMVGAELSFAPQLTSAQIAASLAALQEQQGQGSGGGGAGSPVMGYFGGQPTR